MIASNSLPRSYARPAITVEKAAKEIAKTLYGMSGDHPEMIVCSIDGRCGSGKTTLANAIAQNLDDALVVHLDDFFLRPFQRTEGRLAVPGENVDYERVIGEILIPLQEHGKASYQPFCCKTQQLCESRKIVRPSYLILEGSYAHNYALRPFADYTVFATCDPLTQLLRLADREGIEKLESFSMRWIPLEESYFATYDIEEHADLVVRLENETAATL